MSSIRDEFKKLLVEVENSGRYKSSGYDGSYATPEEAIAEIDTLVEKLFEPEFEPFENREGVPDKFGNPNAKIRNQLRAEQRKAYKGGGDE